MITFGKLPSLAALAIFVLWLLMFRPMGLGGPASYIIVSGNSMEPMLHSGDLAVLKHRDTYSTGDVVTYRIPNGSPGAGSLVIHRITGGSPDAFITQGDNRDHADEWRPSTDDVLGELWFVAPGVGTGLGKLRDPILISSVAGGLVVTLVLLSKPRRLDENAPTLEQMSDA